MNLNTQPSTTSGGLKADAIAAAIAKYTPYFVAFQEICDGELVDIRQRLASYPYGYQMFSYFGANVQDLGGTCSYNTSSGGDYGLGLLVRQSVADPILINQPYREQGTERRSHLCVYAGIAGLTPRVCSTHLDSNRTVAFYQQGEAALDLKNVDQSRLIFMSGDFNNRPADVPNMYYDAQEGDAVNTDPNDITNSLTFSTPSPSEKIDYVWSGKINPVYRRFGARAVNVTNTSGGRVSDHFMLVAYQEV